VVTVVLVPCGASLTEAIVRLTVAALLFALPSFAR